MGVPAGWHPDPNAPGMYRWWDGAAWADMQIPEALLPQPPSAGDKAEVLLKSLAMLLFFGMLAVIIIFIVWAQL